MENRPAEALHWVTKAVLYGAGALAVVAGPVLFFWAEGTGSYFAWKIGNALTPNFMGANYLAGAGAVWAARLDRWSIARVIMPAIIVFGLMQLVATLLHLDVLDWSHPTASAWLAVYIVSPVAAIAVYVLQERRWRPGSETGRPIRGATRLALRAFALASFVIGAALFIAPTAIDDIWPWSLTPLTGRIIGGWYLSGAALQWMLARTRYVEAARVGLAATIAVVSLQLLGALLNTEWFDGPKTTIAIYLVYSAALGLVAVAAGWPLAVRKRRSGSSSTQVLA